MNLHIRTTPLRTRRQRGIALVVSLILLVVVTLLGLAAIRGTTIWQKITGNFYDREISFQEAEAGLSAAAQTLATSPNATTIRPCGGGGGACEADPFTDPNLPPADIQSVSACGSSSGGGCSSGQFTKGANDAAPAQYVIENMGAYPDPNSSTGFNQTANAAQYGAQGVSTTSIFYRITARSGDPAAFGDRSVVTLQAMYKQ